MKITENPNNVITSNPINWTRLLIPINNTLLKWRNIVRIPIFYWKQNIFILWWGAGSKGWTDPDNKGEKSFLDPLSPYTVIYQHETFDEKLQSCLYPKSIDLKIISVTDGSIAEIFYGIYQAKYYFLSAIDGKTINQHSFFDQKRSSLPIFLKSVN